MKQIFLASLIVVATIAILVVGFNPPKRKETVHVLQHVEANRHYWVQLELPTGGDIYGKITEGQYIFWQHRVADIARTETKFLKHFYGEICFCGETDPGMYTYAPTGTRYTSLLLFAKNGEIWEISIPTVLLTPRNGELDIQATVYQ